MADETTPLLYAIKTHNFQAFKTLVEELKPKKMSKRAEKAVEAPSCMMETVGTGKYNYRSLGIRKIRRLNMARGGREGNNALVKDANNYVRHVDENELAKKMSQWNSGLHFVDALVKAKLLNDHTMQSHCVQAVRSGQADFAAHFIKKSESNNFVYGQLSKFHYEALLKVRKDLTQF